MRVIVSGGGTGGHITPVIATITALKKARSNLEVYYLGEGSELSRKLVETAGVAYRRIPTGKWRRYQQSWWKTTFDVKTHLLNLFDLLRFLGGIVHSWWWLFKIQPDVVFAKSGFVALPVGLAAKLRGVPLIIHESDVQAGLTTTILARFATIIATGFPVQHYPQWSDKRVVYTGNPVRPELLQSSKQDIQKYLKLEPNLPTVVVVGGTQGSRVVNNAVMAQLPELLENYQLIHITGQRDYARVVAASKRVTDKHSSRYHFLAFAGDELGPLLAVADLVVSRAGMNFVTELAAMKKVIILVPHPTIAGGHQAANARVLQAAKAAVVLPEARLDELGDMLNQLMAHKTQRQRLQKNIATFYDPRAATVIAKLIVEAA